jgi:hypothetical protein
MSRLALAVLVLLPATASAEISLRVNGTRVDLTARAPLSEVLDRLSRQTGLKVVYDGTVPRPQVNVALVGVTTAQAVTAVLQGLGLDYALQMDKTGTRAATLVLVSGTPVASRATSAAGPDGGLSNAVPDDASQDTETVEDDPTEEVVDQTEPDAEPEPSEASADVKPPQDAPAVPSPYAPGSQPSWPGGAGVPPPLAVPRGTPGSPFGGPVPFTVVPPPTPEPTPPPKN